MRNLLAVPADAASSFCRPLNAAVGAVRLCGAAALTLPSRCRLSAADSSAGKKRASARVECGSRLMTRARAEAFGMRYIG